MDLETQMEAKDEEIQSPKKIYQEVEDTARQLSVMSSKITKVEDLFSSEILAKRVKIKELCDKLISLYPPKAYGSCAREKMWRYVFYDAVVRARKLQKDKPWTPLQLAYIKSHIQTGIGHLHLFTLKIQQCSEFENSPFLSHPGSLDGILNEDMMVINKSRAVTDDERKEQKKLIELMSMCFINIGDLYRYLTDIFAKVVGAEESSDYFYRAQECYTNAFLMNPSSGLSLNQLGNIYSEQNWGIDSAYYLLYGTLTESAYEGAFPNLRQLLDRKLVQFARRPASPEPKPMEMLCHSFMSLIYHLLCEESHLNNYEKFCQETLANFQERLASYDPDLDGKLLFKFASICVMIVWRLQSQNSVHTPPAVAFAMSIFFQLVNQLGVILEEYARVEKITVSSTSSQKDDDAVSISSRSSNHEDKLEDDVKPKAKDKKKNKAGVPRGRRFRNSSVPSLRSLDSADEDSDENENDSSSSESDGDYPRGRNNGGWSASEDEETDDSSSLDSEDEDKILKIPGSSRRNHCKAFDTSSSNGRSETSGSGSNSQKSMDGLRQELLTALGEPGSEIELQDRTVVAEEQLLFNNTPQERMVMDAEGLLKCQGQLEPLLVALTPFIRWLQTCPAVKDALAANAEKIFLEKLCSILSLLLSNNWATSLDGITWSEGFEKDWRKLLTVVDDEDVLFKVELPEDRSMKGFNVLGKFVNDLQIRDNLTKSDELIIRVGRFIHFGFWMDRTGSFSMMYSEEEKRFLVPTPQMLKNKLRFSKMKRLLEGKDDQDSLARLTRAYKDMRVNETGRREGRRRRGGDFNPRRGPRHYRHHSGNRRADDKPICVVVDLEAILKYMHLVKRVASNKNFIVCIPASVFESLDMLKDTDQGEEARGSYIWIDGAIKRAHPGIKILKTTDKKTLDTDYPADPNDIEPWEYIEMVECCSYLIQSEFKGKPYNRERNFFGDFRDKYNVFYLTGNDTILDLSIKRVFDPIKIVRSVQGVYADYIHLYPPRRPPRKGRKWQTSGKCKG